MYHVSTNKYVPNQHHICTMSAQYMSHVSINICTMSAPYMYHVCTIHVQCQHHICTMSAQYMSHVSTIYVQCQHHICTMSAPYMYHVSTIYVPCQHHICIYIPFQHQYTGVYVPTFKYTCIFIIHPDRLHYILEVCVLHVDVHLELIVTETTQFSIKVANHVIDALQDSVSVVDEPEKLFLKFQVFVSNILFMLSL